MVSDNSIDSVDRSWDFEGVQNESPLNWAYWIWSPVVWLSKNWIIKRTEDEYQKPVEEAEVVKSRYGSHEISTQRFKGCQWNGKMLLSSFSEKWSTAFLVGSHVEWPEVTLFDPFWPFLTPFSTMCRCMARTGNCQCCSFTMPKEHQICVMKQWRST